MNNMVIGQYIDTDSFLNKANAKTKFISLMLLMVVTFIGIDVRVYFILTLLVIYLFSTLKLQVSVLLNLLQPVIYLVIFIWIFNLLFGIHGGQVLFEFFFIKVSTLSIWNSFVFSYRMVVIFVLGTLFSISTKPLDFAYGFEDLIRPLKRIKVPVAEIALMLSLTLRFIPTLFEEMQLIQKAQMSRGADLENGSLRAKISGLISMLLPLFIISFIKAEKMALAMEARGFIDSNSRTRYRESKFEMLDYIIFTSVIMLSILIILLQIKVV